MTGPLRILYVDDDADIRTIVEMALLLDPMIDVRAFASGRAALQAIAQDAWRPTAIILDYMMPDMNGVALLAELRRYPDLADTPAVFMTARGNDSGAPDLHQYGAAGVILKPFDPIELVGMVRAIIARAA